MGAASGGRRTLLIKSLTPLVHGCRTFAPGDVVVNVTVEAASAVPIWYIPYFIDTDSQFNATRVYSNPDSAIVVLQEDVPMMDVTLYAYPPTVLNVGTL